MMMDPTNQLPTDPAWLKRVDAVTRAAVNDLKCMVVMVAVQEDGKTAVSVAGAPKTGELAEMAKDPAATLLILAGVVHAQDEFHKAHKQ